MSFTFYSCFISEASSFCFHTAKQQYLAEEVRQHLATMCRIHNDCGSIERDQEEKNLNSADFPEFHPECLLDDKDAALSVNESDEQVLARKKDLLWIAGYEEDTMKCALDKLKNDGLEPKLQRALQLFVVVTVLYGQIYVARDIGVATGRQS
jgi:hypothetical protein